MIRSVASKVAWVGRTASMVFGLALVLALMLGVASTALGANGGNFILGKGNNVATKVTGLIGKVATGTALVVKNPSGGSALGLRVSAGKAPLTVNADAGKATNLDADKLDGKEAPLVAMVNSLGNPLASPDVATTEKVKLSTGIYVVPFHQSVWQCHRVVSLGQERNVLYNPEGSAPSTGEATTANVHGVPDAQTKIMVITRNSAGTLADKSFYLAVFCRA